MPIRNETITLPPESDRCLKVGHDWIEAPDAAIVGRRCVHCPAIGAPCPECGSGERRCLRCRGTGVIELVEVSLAEVGRLWRTRQRFAWLIKEFSHQQSTPAERLIREIDALIELGASCGMIRGRPTAEVAREERKKKPSAGVNRPRAAENNPAVVPVPGSTDNTSDLASDRTNIAESTDLA